MHRSHKIVTLSLLLISSLALSACGGGSASLPSGSGLSSKQAASDEVQASSGSALGGMFDGYTEPATTATSLGVDDPLSASYDPEMLDTSGTDTLDAVNDVFAQTDTTDLALNGTDDLGTTLDVGTDSLTSGTDGLSLDSALADSTDSSMATDDFSDISMDDPTMDDPEFDDSDLDDPSMDDPEFDY